jgi:outer membrane protein OmpA-like peptidoglycan-associated protein
LYFSSKGHPGYGSNDMYVSTRLDDSWTNWSEPLNLGSSINTVGWDAYFSVPANGEYAYFVSYTNSIGKGDVFRQKLPTSAKPAPVVLISGRVLHEKTKQPLRAKIIYENLSDGTIVGEAYSDSITGEFKIILPAGKKYGIGANKNGFFSVSENIDLTKLNEYQEIKKDLLMVPIEVGSVARLNNIFFDLNKSTLTSDSYNELKKLIKVLNTYPNMKIEIGGHTDNVGSETYNLDLSNKRAKSVYDYLISKGVSSSRLTYKGYGKSKLILNGDSEEANQINRRVEFLILQK